MATERLDAYHFYEEDWDDYDQLRDTFEWEIPDQFNMAEYVSDRWADDRGRIALYAEDADGHEQTFTFADICDYSNQLANYLAARGVRQGDHVGINVPQKPETLLAHVATWKLGAVSVPLSTLFGVDALSYRLDDADVTACVVDRSNVDTLRAVCGDVDTLDTILTVDVDTRLERETDIWNALEGESTTFDVVETDAEDDAIIIYSSGTTGNPKGVLHAHRVLLGHLPMFLTTFCNLEIGEDDVFWTPAEWAWVASLFDVVFPGLFYGKPVLAYAGGKFDPQKAFELVAKYGVTSFFAPPTALRMMMHIDGPNERWNIDSVRVVPSGGESLGQSIVDWAKETFNGAAVHEGYGQTEANLIVGDCTALTEFREGKMGLAAPGHDVRIVDPRTAELIVDRDGEGEIAIRYEGDPVCFKEYVNDPERTRQKIQNEWLLTEDLGSRDTDGYFSFKSRKDDVIISAGYRIGPEENLASHEAVADAAVVGIPDDDRGEVPKAFVVLDEGYEPSDELRNTLQSHVKERLAQYEYPRKIAFVEQLPKTTTGKIRREDLRDREGP